MNGKNTQKSCLQSSINDFAIGSIIGKAWETLYTGKNTGVCLGPWIPLYGVGLMLIKLSLRKIDGSPIRKILVTWILVVFLEYIVGYMSKDVLGVELWNYCKDGKDYKPICPVSVGLELVAVIGVYFFGNYLDTNYNLTPLGAAIGTDLVVSSVYTAKSSRCYATIIE